MKKINELKTQNTSLRELMRDLNTAALEEKRDFTEAEQAKYDGYKDEISKNERTLERLEEQEKINTILASNSLRNDDDGEKRELVHDQATAWREYVKVGTAPAEYMGPNGGFLLRADPLLTTTEAGIIQKAIQPMSVVNTQGLDFARALGVNILTGLTGTVELPNMAQIDSSVVAENAAVGSAGASPAVIEMKAKTFGSTQAFSKQFLLTSSPDVVSKILTDMAAANERKILAELFDSFAVDAIDASVATTVAGLTYGDMVNLKAIDYNLGNTAYVTTTAVRAYLEQLNASSASIKFAWDMGVVAGEAAYATAAANANNIVFGDWSSAVIGIWGAPEVILDVFKYKEYGKTEVAVMSYADAAIQNYRSFQWCDDASAGIA